MYTYGLNLSRLSALPFLRHVLVADQDAAAGRHLQPGDHAQRRRLAAAARPQQGHQLARSEEHTSDIQSLMRISYAVFSLKKTKITLLTTSHTHHNIPVHPLTTYLYHTAYHPYHKS